MTRPQAIALTLTSLLALVSFAGLFHVLQDEAAPWRVAAAATGTAVFVGLALAVLRQARVG